MAIFLPIDTNCTALTGLPYGWAQSGHACDPQEFMTAKIHNDCTHGYMQQRIGKATFVLIRSPGL